MRWCMFLGLAFSGNPAFASNLTFAAQESLEALDRNLAVAARAPASHEDRETAEESLKAYLRARLLKTRSAEKKNQPERKRED